MKSKLIYIHLLLLVISSGILFIFVAAENGITLNGDSININKDKENVVDIAQLENIYIEDPPHNSEDIHLTPLIKREQDDQKIEEIRSSFDDVASESLTSDKEDEGDVNSNTGFNHASINEELSGSDHGVIFTLIDSASQELHQQAAAAASLMTNTINDSIEIITGPITIPLPTESEIYNIKAEHEPVADLGEDPVENKPIIDSHNETMELEKKESVDGTTTPPTTMPQNNLTNNSIIVTQEPQAKHEDIPSFSEWAQKQLAEAEKKKVENKTGGSTKRGIKLRSKNYASPDCGAKVVNSNPEAGSPWAVLSSSRDEYILNSCNNKIWFIVELCEAIQPKKIELANFELFSSILREFSVYVSDRLPTRDWTLVGQFEGKEVRTIQSFNLLVPSTAFVKYIKVEFNSHYGNEHYCPISLFRVYGTSEFEVLDSVDEAQSITSSVGDEDEEDEEDEFEDEENQIKPKNLFSSAKDAVLSIVKIAAEALGKNENELSNGTGNFSIMEPEPFICFTPAYIVVCDNCSDEHFNRVYDILSCEMKDLEQLLKSQFIWKAVANSEICISLGLDLRTNNGAPYPVKSQTSIIIQNKPSRYVDALFSVETISSLCNIIAIDQKRVVLNITYESLIESNETVTVGQTDIPVILVDPPSTCSIDSTIPSSVPYEDPSSVLSDSLTSETILSNSPPINPTKTLTAEENVLSAHVMVDPSLSTHEPEINHRNHTFENRTSDLNIQAPKTINEETMQGEGQILSSSEEVHLDHLHDESTVGGDAINFDSLFSELDESESDPSSSPQSATLNPPQLLHRESVFVRLAKRIKALERNMSLSGQYLEELSRRYKRQVEEMQRTLAEFTEERKKGEEREERRNQQMIQLAEQVSVLTIAVNRLTEDRDSWMVKHWVVIIIEIILCALVMFVYQYLPDIESTRNRLSNVFIRAKTSGSNLQRTLSVDDALKNNTKHQKKRRPSEEALKISGSTHKELLIEDASRKNSRTGNRRRKKKEQTKPIQPTISLESLASINYDSTQTELGVKNNSVFKLPPPPLPLAGGSSEVNGLSNGNSINLPLPGPPPPNYIRTALSFRKNRTALRKSSIELSDKSNNSSNTSIKKTGPLKKIVRKFF